MEYRRLIWAKSMFDDHDWWGNLQSDVRIFWLIFMISSIFLVFSIMAIVGALFCTENAKFCLFCCKSTHFLSILSNWQISGILSLSCVFLYNVQLYIAFSWWASLFIIMVDDGPGDFEEKGKLQFCLSCSLTHIFETPNLWTCNLKMLKFKITLFTHVKHWHPHLEHKVRKKSSTQPGHKITCSANEPASGRLTHVVGVHHKAGGLEIVNGRG